MGRAPRKTHPAVTPGAPFLLYTTEDGRTRLEVHLQNETVWLSRPRKGGPPALFGREVPPLTPTWWPGKASPPRLNQMAELFQRDKSTISRYVANIFEEGKLERASVVADFATTAADGKNHQIFKEAAKQVRLFGKKGDVE